MTRSSAFGHAADAAEVRRLEAQLRKVRGALSSLADAVLVLDPAGRVEELNSSAEKLIGKTSREAVGRGVSELLTLFDEDEYEIDLAPHLGAGEPRTLDDATSLLPAGGERLTVEGGVQPMLDEDGKTLLGAALVVRDVSDRKRLAQRLTRAARFDALTGLLNRGAFDQHVQEAYERTEEGSWWPGEDGESRGDVLCHMDLDQFQVVNDTCGHAAGDLLVQWIANLIRERLRDADVLARLGGDEFGLLIHNTPMAVAEHLAEEIHAALRNFRFVWQDKSFNVGMSIGIVAISHDFTGIDDLNGAAHRACILAKQRGRGRTEVYRQDDAELRQHKGQVNWVVKLHQALDEDLFHLEWQRIVPIRPLVSDGPLCFEVLLRFSESDGTAHLPGEFLPAAERFGLMPAIDCWVVKRVIALLVDQPPEFLDLLDCCTVNLSGASLGDREVAAAIDEELERSGLPGQKLCFEITETAAVANLRRAAEMMEFLRRRHCRWALDDFGSGMSSFRYLHELPVDFVKIDGKIVSDVLHSRLSRAVVRSIHQVAHVIDACTIAENVENVAILQALRELGIDFGQGYHLARPRRIEAREDASTYLDLELERELEGEAPELAMALRDAALRSAEDLP
ncbi:MAG: EAL domain-containing protein [Acidobacteriota bacterium]